MQTILGAGGAIGIELAKALQQYTDNIRLVSRNPEKVNESDKLFAADILDPVALAEAVKGSKVVYVTVGFQYKYRAWKENWPGFIQELIDICEKEDCKLVFFDNAYMYDKDDLNPMTENSSINPPSKKGLIRAQVAEMIMQKTKTGRLKALIARSADFYGPSITNSSILTETVFKPLSKGKTANWLANDRHRHSFTFTPDAGRATAILGNSEKAYGQVWHLPTASHPLTGREWIETIANKLGVKFKYRVVPKFMVRIMGLFVPVMKETVEMLYQYDRDYIFDSSKFEKEFNFKPTSYINGIEKIINIDYSEGFSKK